MTKLPTFKTVSPQGRLGQKGINLIERVVLEMGSTWTPGGPNEVGIDGYIELFDPGSGAALGTVVPVQSKATAAFTNESDEGFDFRCERRDIDYWLHSNHPLILVVSRPDANEAYWVCIKDYFSVPARAGSTRVRFCKAKDRFDPNCLPRLIALGRAPDSGLYLAPAPIAETLHSNLLRLEGFPPRIHLASTEIRTPGELWASLRTAAGPIDGAWLLRERKIIAFHDLRERPWSDVCDRGTVESFDALEWASSDDPDVVRQFVQLLNQTLRTQLYPEVRYWPQEECYAYSLGDEDGDRKIGYRSLKKDSSISAVRRMVKEVEDRKLVTYRHAAFRGQFRRLEDAWCLEITPTYRFTRDGLALHPFHEELLKGIKRMEGNRAVLSMVLFWAHQLRAQDGLLDEGGRPLAFGDLLSFSIDTGIRDEQWQAQETDETAPTAASGASEQNPTLDFGDL